MSGRIEYCQNYVHAETILHIWKTKLSASPVTGPHSVLHAKATLSLSQVCLGQGQTIHAAHLIQRAAGRDTQNLQLS
jgi:hypothetical protein